MSVEKDKSGLDVLSPRRWVAVLCIGLMHAVCMGSAMMPAGYSAIIVGQWGVDQGSYVQLLMVTFLAGSLFSIPAGILADKFGVTKILGISMVLSVIFSAARVFAVQAANFDLVFWTTFFMGTGLAGMNANSVKFLQPWFKHKMSTGMTLYISGAGIGVSSATFLAAVLPDSIVLAFQIAVGVFAVCCVIWFALARMPKDFVAVKDDYSLKAIKTVCTNKLLILVSIAMVLSMASSASYAGAVPVAFIGKGLEPSQAALWATFISLAGLVSNWFTGPIADAVKRIKPVMAAGCIFASALLIFGWAAPLGGYTLPIILIGCFIGWGNIGLIKGSVGLIPTLPKQYLGTAGGIQTFFQNLSAYFVPSFILTPLSGGGANPTFFVLCAVCVILSGVVFMFVPELGIKSRLRAQVAESDPQE
ncbi:MAG: MFS transporter [Coriobacteriales bacterium]|jgi:NNP family nitrate/nitrite transporter-like MFS transporter|nr:MFS transporter [Coriobacteriales bacterium]